MENRKDIIEILFASTECCGKNVLTLDLQDDVVLKIEDDKRYYILRQHDRYSICKQCGQQFVRQWSERVLK